ncbi:hypothetical protein Nos7524_2822 [Nostoc sp. PCC 7524]|uniref:hypothetical protein n=1 Tax=Nostoc sp. (strain ATCC 29411 / PCC 7524) TaxID=28072 RepID=UPI00029ED56C|nr:hypothetical protein [Nostoc sp. PCC 7524]AFY48642.1 hypothetical protein Nos7524_2822 [Nostoc sp. PCC 7524]
MVNKSNPNQSNNTFDCLKVKIVISGVATAAAVGMIPRFLPPGFPQAGFYPQHSKQSVQESQLRRISRLEYEQLIIGMSLTDVRSILGLGTEVRRSATTATFEWKNPDDSKITVTFENDQLKTKEQSGLN